MNSSEAEWKDYWKKRKIDWKTSYLDTWNHPHRDLIIRVLKNLPFISLFEIGCGPGPNLVKIVKELPGKQIGGCDISEDAIELANKTFSGGMFKVASGNNILMSDKSVDVVLTDMALIYVDKSNIDSYIDEIKRIGRKYVLLCEFHSPSLLKRLTIKWKSGYNCYDWKKLLESKGFYEVETMEIPQELWEDSQKVRTLVIAKIPKR